MLCWDPRSPSPPTQPNLTFGFYGRPWKKQIKKSWINMVTVCWTTIRNVSATSRLNLQVCSEVEVSTRNRECWKKGYNRRMSSSTAASEWKVELLSEPSLSTPRHSLSFALTEMPASPTRLLATTGRRCDMTTLWLGWPVGRKTSRVPSNTSCSMQIPNLRYGRWSAPYWVKKKIMIMLLITLEQSWFF